MPHRGSCLCGAVRLEIDGELHAPDACHCSQCRRMTGHYWASTDVPDAQLRISGAEHVRWYQSSAKVKRGFCANCGSVLFWKPLQRDTTAVSMGALETPTDTQLARHIFVADKGDYYRIDDGLPQNPQ
ncbi:GFA family protein [Tahibacter harae]|uniref:GFA family protein n=1 Tax=Tahibacter harae TaxID=2963937 RepID=A0ABT1QUU4_9GAMM|nr:GFA family protein [Tahibacter harae]MCQ4166059.1 GFA family protein [Tahibacter harae]